MKPIKYMIEQTYSQGLKNLVAGETDICFIDGENGKLSYRGYDVEELAVHSTFDEVAYLLIHGELPTSSQFDGWIKELKQWHEPPEEALTVLKSLPADAHAMMLLRTMVTISGCQIPEEDNVRLDAQWRRPARILSWSSSLAAAAICHIFGKDPNPFYPEKSFSANFLTRSLGRKPNKNEMKAFDVSMIVQAEHGFNVAALAALTVISTGADLGSAVIAGMSTIAGKLHGGANQLAFQNLVQHQTAEEGRQWALSNIDDGYLFPGFGHRIYKTGDPRVKILEPYAKELLEQKGDRLIWDIYQAVREVVEEHLSEKGVYVNVGGVTGLIYHALGFPTDAFPIPLAIALQVGWMAHCLEYLSEGVILEPRAIYTDKRVN